MDLTGSQGGFGSGDERSHEVGPARPPRVVLTVAEAAELLGIGRTLMYSLVTSGDVESVRIGRLRRVPVTAVAAYVEALRAAQGAEGVVA